MRSQIHETGYSLIDILVTIVLLGIISMIVMPTLIDAFDRSRQRATLAEMRQVSMSLGTHHIDVGGYPTGVNTLNQLMPQYLAAVPESAWGVPFLYIGLNPDGCGYLLVATGSDGLFGPPPPIPWNSEQYTPDLWLVNGTFLQAPGVDNAVASLASILTSRCS